MKNQKTKNMATKLYKNQRKIILFIKKKNYRNNVKNNTNFD